jgi:hypothetical protein
MTKLTEIGLKYRTDKAYDHQFTEAYDEYFQKYTNPRLLEIGVYNGASLQTYNEYFDYKCTLIGMDNGEQLGSIPDHENISIVIADQSRAEELASRAEGEFDIILDDGSHFVEHQINCFKALIGKVKKGGIYIIEDLHCCYHPFYNPNGVQDTIKFLQTLDRDLYGIKNINIFSDVDLSEATNLSHITSVIEL